MFKFVRTAQITSYFTTSLDRKLSNAVEGMDGVKDFSEFNVRMVKMDANKALKVTIDDVEDLLTLQYGNPAILPVLQVLYPHLDYKNSKFHIDHIYPKAKFSIKNKALSPDFLEEKKYLFNLQLLEGVENIRKKDADPDVWIIELSIRLLIIRTKTILTLVAQCSGMILRHSKKNELKLFVPH